mgnify:CR=1 FL=1
MAKGAAFPLDPSGNKCRHCILYLLRLRPPFPNDGKIPKSKLDLGLDHIEINLRKVFLEKYNFFMK